MSLEFQRQQCTIEFQQNKANGMMINEIRTYENYLESLLIKIRRKKELLARLREQEEAKRQEVVEAKKETSSIDKLKEHKQMEYDKEVQKQEEHFIEEFVTTRDAMARLSGRVSHA